jgi:hypothetical protein
MRDAPNVMLAVSVSDNAVMVTALQNGELDLVVNYLVETPYAGCVTEYLFHDDVVVFASATHPMARLKSVTMAQIGRERWALGPVQQLSWHWFYRAFQDCHRLTVALETRSLQLRISTVASSRLLGFNSRRTIPPGRSAVAPQGAFGARRNLAPPGRRDLSRRRLPLPCRPTLHRDSENGCERVCEQVRARHLDERPSRPIANDRLRLPTRRQVRIRKRPFSALDPPKSASSARPTIQLQQHRGQDWPTSSHLPETTRRSGLAASSFPRPREP